MSKNIVNVYLYLQLCLNQKNENKIDCIFFECRKIRSSYRSTKLFYYFQKYEADVTDLVIKLNKRNEKFKKVFGYLTKPIRVKLL